jgi:hypothetical protein
MDIAESISVQEGGLAEPSENCIMRRFIIYSLQALIGILSRSLT